MTPANKKILSSCALFLFAFPAALASSGCERQEQETEAQREGATIEAIEQDPQKWYGKTVTVKGEVDDLYNQRSFELESDELWDDDVFVVMRSDMQELVEDAEVQVTGTVKQFVVADIEREIGWDLNPELEAEYRDKPVVIAESVTVTNAPQKGRVAQGQQEEQQFITAVAVIHQAPVPEDLEGRQVDLQRVRVQKVIGESGFWIGENGQSQIFVRPEEQLQVDEGQMANIQGTLERMPDQQTMKQQWNVDDRELQKLGQQKLFVKGTQVEMAPAQARR